MASNSKRFWQKIRKQVTPSAPDTQMPSPSVPDTQMPSPSDAEVIAPSFDVAYYVARAEGVSEADAVNHYLDTGAALGLSPAQWFDPEFYLARYPDVAEAGLNPFVHFIKFGHGEGRQASDHGFFALHQPYHEEFARLLHDDPGAESQVADIRRFGKSDTFAALVRKAAALEPEIGSPTWLQYTQYTMLPHWHDLDYLKLSEIRALIPQGDYDSVVLMPAGRMGGADLVAAILAHALNAHENVLILRTEDTHWDRPDWFPDTVNSIDISRIAEMAHASRALYTLLCALRPKRIFNVNSRLAFETFTAFGKQLAAQFNLYAYYFCADRTEDDVEAGYPVWCFSNLLPHLTAALLDTHSLAKTLTERFAIPESLAGKLRTVYTPAQTRVSETSVAQRQIVRAAQSAQRRPCILWAGRLDRQKRFDFLLEVARIMPDVDFRCWGKAVLDAPPDLDALPDNVVVCAPFTTYDDLPLSDCDGWFYTAAWDGLPTILIELGALGMPIAATGVGGVPELVDETTGWMIDEDASAADAADVLRAMIADPDARVARAAALQARVRARHNMDAYTRFIASI